MRWLTLSSTRRLHTGRFYRHSVSEIRRRQRLTRSKMCDYNLLWKFPKNIIFKLCYIWDGMKLLNVIYSLVYILWDWTNRFGFYEINFIFNIVEFNFVLLFRVRSNKPLFATRNMTVWRIVNVLCVSLQIIWIRWVSIAPHCVMSRPGMRHDSLLPNQKWKVWLRSSTKPL